MPFECRAGPVTVTRRDLYGPGLSRTDDLYLCIGTSASLLAEDY